MKRIILFFAALCLTSSARADREQCFGTYAMAASAISNRDNGLTQDQLRQSIPPRDAANRLPQSSKALLLLMHQILDEIYETPQIDEITYAVFKAEQCYRQASKKPTPDDFKAVAAQLFECTKLPKKAKTECAMDVAGSSASDESK